MACALSIAAFAYDVVIPAAKTPYTNGFATLYTESRILFESPRDLQNIYRDDWFQQRVDRFLGRHVAEIAQGQPPTMSLILAPLAWLSPERARIAWILLSVLMWVAGLAALADGLALQSFCGVAPVVWLTAATTPLPPLAENLRRGQGYALLFCLLCLVIRGVLRDDRPRGWTLGIPLGLMFILKSAGLWLYPLLAATRRWRIPAGAVVTVMTIMLVCSPLMGWRIWPLYLTHGVRWLSTEPSNHVTAYQTVQSLTGHLFIRDVVWNPRPIADIPTLAKLISGLVIASLFGLSVRLQRLDGQDREQRALTMGMFVAPLIAVAPIGEGYHYVLVFPAVLIGWWWALRTPATRKRRWLLAACTLLISTPQSYYSAPILQQGWAALLAYPRVYGALALWGLFAYTLKTLRAADSPHPIGSVFQSRMGQTTPGQVSGYIEP